jgi:hypothetical protein
VLRVASAEEDEGTGNAAGRYNVYGRGVDEAGKLDIADGAVGCVTSLRIFGGAGSGMGIADECTAPNIGTPYSPERAGCGATAGAGATSDLFGSRIARALALRSAHARESFV